MNPLRHISDTPIESLKDKNLGPFTRAAIQLVTVLAVVIILIATVACGVAFPIFLVWTAVHFILKAW